MAGPPGDPKDAWRTLDPVVRATNRGVILMERYEYAGAVQAFEQALKLAPGSAEARVNLAIALFNRAAKGDLERTEKLLEEVLRDQPDHLRAIYFRGITHQYGGRDEQAVSFFERVLKLAPHDSHAWYLLARSKAHLKQPCRTELERAVKENPALGSAYYDLMRLAFQEGKEDEALAYQKKFTQIRQSPLSDMVVIPQYRRMGALAVVRPMSGPPRRSVTSGELSAGQPRLLLKGFSGDEIRCGKLDEMRSVFDIGVAIADVNGDGRLDLAAIAPLQGGGGVLLLLGDPDQTFTDATGTSGLGDIHQPVSCAFGDYDNDGKVDLFVICAGPNHLLRGRGDGTFQDVTDKTNTAGPNALTLSAVFLDADHDADLDIYVANGCGPVFGEAGKQAGDQLLNNNSDGTFTDIAAGAGVTCGITMAPGDIDGDRDTDLAVFDLGGPARVFFNDRLGKYHAERITDEPISASCGVLQDFNGDGRADLLALLVPRTVGRLFLSTTTRMLEVSRQFDECLETLATWGKMYTTRVADVDLDGDLDVAFLGRAGHVLLNDGWGRFVAKPNVWPQVWTDETIAVELADLTGDGVPDLLRVLASGNGTVELVPTRLTPPANWLAITPTGDRGEDKSTRSPASGFGVRIELRCGLHSQVITYTGLNGGLSQSQQPLVFGLNGATKADYLAFTWPDGVTQCENELAAGTHHRIKEMERRVSSCPVLFAWNGRRFGFVGDFAGVGGLGYFVAPGQYAPPQALEHVKIEAEQLVTRDGFYELRVCEPMEEVAYVDRLELLAVDHPRGLAVYPDERLAVTGPPPTHRLLCPADPVFPVSATGPHGEDCTEELARVDRVYAYQPQLDRRFCGFCEPHTLVLDFADRLADVVSRSAARAKARGSETQRGVYLFLNGSIEYPYSQTTYASAQASVVWQPPKIERLTDGRWETIVPDAGAPGGMSRTIAIDLTGRLPTTGDCKLRITTNLEIYYDRIFIAADRGTDDFAIRTVPLARADLHRLGFPLEYSPDGQHPTIYTYDVIEPTSSFKTPSGAYTRYGPVESLLDEFDDRYVILGTGDELAVSFDARTLPPPAQAQVRSFILVSHAYCKDMDLYTAEPDTVEPLPFRKMSAYPYPSSERYPDTEKLRHARQRFNTRLRP